MRFRSSAALALAFLLPLAGSIMPEFPTADLADMTSSATRMLAMLNIGTAALLAAILGLALLRRLLIRSRSVRTSGTCDCGYIAP